MAKPPAVKNADQLLHFQDCSNDVKVVATATASISVIAARTGFTVYVRRITGSVTTVAAGTLTFQDTGSPSVVVGVVPSSASVGSLTLLDAYQKGVALTESAGLSLVGTAAGTAGVYYIEAYYYPSAAGAI